MRNLSLFTLAACGLMAGSASLAQTGEGVTGDWVGTVTEREGDQAVEYGILVKIDLDRDGDPVGVVSYDLGCMGIWTGVSRLGPVWRFEETIIAGRANCAPHVNVELGPVGEGFRVRLLPIGEGNMGDGTLRRRLEPQP